MAENEESDKALNESELGTKEYWVEHYKTEVENFKEYGDVGEVWFGNSILRDVLKWFQNNANIKYDEPIIDLGCGNGMSLISLAKLGYTNLTGVDYSQEAIDLAISIMNEQQLSGIRYQVADLISGNDVNSLGLYKAVFDKGTYDAICLSPDDSQTKRKLYKENVWKLLIESGIFIITSCNWTENELKVFFSSQPTLGVILDLQDQTGTDDGHIVRKLALPNLFLLDPPPTSGRVKSQHSANDRPSTCCIVQPIRGSHSFKQF